MRVAVIGAGAVGLACAARLARAGATVFVIERHGRVAQETSSRSSEVVHAGLYYPRDSLKAQSCVRGRELLVQRCQRLGIGYRKIGKVVVATDSEEALKLEQLHRQGIDNGAGALRLLDQRELKGLEPNVRASLGLWSPETGIFDSHGFCESLRAEAVEHGATLVLRHELTSVHGTGPLSMRVRSEKGEESELEVDWLVNAAGLSADCVARASGVDVAARRLSIHPCKGDYFVLSPRLRGLTNHLVYPLPDRAGLGIHITQDLAFGLRAGPDTEYVATPAYQVDPGKATAFGAALRRYLASVRDEDLAPGYAGVRPKLAGPGEGFRDFVCEVFPEAPRAVQLLGIESPGLTAALALAERVAANIEAE